MQRSTYTILDIAHVIASTKFLHRDGSLIKHLIHDTRKINDPKHSLFFALKGNKDGHYFITQAYNAGIRNFVVEEGKVDIDLFEGANFLIVEDSLKALQGLAKYHRQRFDIPVIAITGSNGKTVVKEWLNQLLNADFNIVRSPKSYNSQIGVALSLWQINSSHSLAIIEAGISRPGEMERLKEMIQPTVGVLTSIGPAHDEGFTSRAQKLDEKLKLFQGVETLIYSPQYVAEGHLIVEKQHFLTWGNEEGVDLRLVDSLMSVDLLSLKAIYHDQQVEIEIPFSDEASIENALTCWSVLLSMNYPEETIRKRMKTLQPVEMRLELKNGVNNCSIIDDSYSCDISSLVIALNFLQQQNQHKKRALILSDIPGSEKDHDFIYQTVSSLVESNGISRFIGIGPVLSRYASLFSSQALFFNSTADFIHTLPNLHFQDEAILLKGARVFEFERISKLLTLKTHDTSLEINLKALEYNLKYYKSKLDTHTKLMVMVKAFSYGSGSFEIANLLQFNQVDYLTVAYPDEGITLRMAGIKLPIMVMNPGLTSFEALIDNQLEPEIFTIDNLNYLINLLEARGISNYPIHIKVETGMHRLGFDANDFEELLQLLTTNKAVKVASVFSHLAASGMPEHDDFTREQITKLRSFSDSLKETLPYSFLTHISNTAAIERWPEAQFDMVRLGIGLYGVASANEGSKLETVATLRASISQIKQVTDSDTVGYNRKGRLKGGGTIATVKVGYADGYSRRFGNGAGKMLVSGKLVPTIGDICMDMCMLDITDVNAKVGDEVVVFGENLSIESLAAIMATIPYEIMTGISQRVKRIYFYE